MRGADFVAHSGCLALRSPVCVFSGVKPADFSAKQQHRQELFVRKLRKKGGLERYGASKANTYTAVKRSAGSHPE
jgi:hypothetical protein